MQHDDAADHADAASLSGDSDIDVNPYSSADEDEVDKTEDPGFPDGNQAAGSGVADSNGRPTVPKPEAAKDPQERPVKQVRIAAPDIKAEAAKSKASEYSSAKVAISKQPFFTWRISGDEETREEIAISSTISRLLKNINSDLASREVVGKLYCKAYKCSLVEFEQRHQDWIVPISTPNPSEPHQSRRTSVNTHMSGALPQNGVASDAGAPARSEHTDATTHKTVEDSNKEESLHFSATFSSFSNVDIDDKATIVSAMSVVHSDSGNPAAARPGERWVSLTTLEEQGQDSSKESIKSTPRLLLDVSSEIMGLFVPAELHHFHPLIERYWGALDRILRVSVLDQENKLKS